jgi:FkbM family methyltransferase
MNNKQFLIAAFEQHVSGNLPAARSMYAEVLTTDPSDLFARVLTNLTEMQVSFARGTKSAALRNLKNCGFNPATVIDVGAQVGTPPLYEIFPDAHHVMLEPVKEHETILKGICQSLKSAEYMIVAVSSKSGNVTLSVTDNLQYASIDLQVGLISNNRIIEAICLNDLTRVNQYSGPFLIKIDVDGVEIDVLKGASALISPETVFIIEATMADEIPRFPRIIDFLRLYGFVLHDIIDNLYRPSDNSLWQVDVIMVHENSPLRSKCSYV